MIDLLPSPEQTEITEAIARFLREHEAPLWPDLAELGCFGLAQPDSVGGLGLSLAEDALVFREFGRHGLSLAVLGTVLAASIAGDAPVARALIDGTRRAGVGAWVEGGLQIFDTRAGDLVVVWDETGAELFDSTAFSGIQGKKCFDGSVSLALVPHVGDPILRVAGDRIARLAAVLIAALLTGIIEGARDMAVEYAKTRTQFGQPIGAFQAVKHICANIALGAEASWAQTAYAALAHDQGSPDAPFQAWNAKSVAGTAALDAARANIQIHGGMGFTAEIGAHLYLKRAHVLNELGGSLRSLSGKLLSLPAGT